MTLEGTEESSAVAWKQGDLVVYFSGHIELVQREGIGDGWLCRGG